jgi:serine/threonine protein phosphatase PrpC
MAAVELAMTGGGCPVCGHPWLAGDVFCEQCGAPLASTSGDRAEQGDDQVGAVSDVGRRRPRNEDAFGVTRSERHTALVVCDGVASTPLAGSAAAQAVAGAMRVLSRASDVGDEAALRDLVGRAVDAARLAVVPLAGAAAPALPSTALAPALTSPTVEPETAAVLRATPPPTRPVVRATADHLVPPDDDAPATTIVLAVVSAGTVVVAGLGDSRAYWVPDGGNEVLLTDDDARAAASLTVDAAIAGARAAGLPLSRQLTAWVGADDGGVQPQVTSLEVREPGTLVLCTDGLWQYVERPGGMAELVARCRRLSPESAVGLARLLVDAAVSAGGSDNVTAAVTRLAPAYEGG